MLIKNFFERDIFRPINGVVTGATSAKVDVSAERTARVMRLP